MSKDKYSIIRKKVTDISIVKYPIISFLFCIILITVPAVAFAGGDGSAENPYQISNVNELQNIQNDLGANYVLINNIDASATSEWNDGAGFEPIGDYDYRFTGFLDGNNYTISNLYINNSSSEYVGLFGFTRKNDGLLIVDLRLENINVSGFTYVGGVVGRHFQGEVNNIYVTGNMNGDSNVGTLIGYNSGNVTNTNSNGNVTSNGDYAGGLIGRNEGNVSDSYATGNITSNGKHTGGLVGGNSGSITNSHVAGHVIGDSNVGILVGYNNGYDGNYVTITNSYATGNVIGNSNVGSLVGYNYGHNSGNLIITNSYATGNVTSYGDRAGGLVGYNHGYYGGHLTITNSYATGNVTSYGDRAGGLVGYNHGYYDGYVTITNSYAKGNVTTNGNYGGGLVGYNYNYDSISHDSYVKIKNSYATGNVNGHWYMGGLVGYNDAGGVTNCYAIGNINGNDYLGGLVAENSGDVSDSYYNKETSGQSDTGKGIPKTTIEMKEQSTYTNWDFDNAWFIHGSINDGYPQLHNFISVYPPVSDFTSNVTSGVVPPLSVKFTDLSSKEPTQWLWDFGDGNTSTDQNPTHTYTNYGNYNVSLTAINDVADDTETKIDYITIDENIICMAKSIGFNDSSAVEDSTLTIPLELLNVSNGPIQTIKCDIQYNESILSLESIDSGNLTSGWTVSKGINEHSITLTTSDSELTIQNESSGQICNITFSVVGKSGESTELIPWNVDLANTANLHGYASSKTGIFTIEAPGRLSGNVSYNFNGTNIENADVSLMQSGNLIAKNTTNTSGYYIFTNIEPGAYNIIFDKPGFYSEEISVQISAGSDIYRDSNMIITGDLDGNGISADAVDVNMMMQASVGNLASDRYFDLDKNEEFADAVDVNMMIQASVGDIVLE
ncbi:GLUG motif-containing protein [Methanohalophilus mahii]|uniref:PKD domain containing protein n=1 Tax=Methanohalophilus mahii (strain ATCC 35705 / DSM 5219 / SLP) TaxID=547558 RepID=D5E6M3_METMS|nr:GLUG motif-containing protein [Methanohalophilus mahii]ADE36811.1 PKD domain containing protein [Methanohalophilus mahii DSM 5219]